jgi:hypothetical protein
MKLVNLISVLVKRDANTTTPTQVMEHELPLLRSVHGKEQITGGNVVGQREVNEATEYGRLSAKYGTERMEKVYGDEESGKLEAAIKEAKPIKSKPETGAKSQTLPAPPSAPESGTGTQASGAAQ